MSKHLKKVHQFMVLKMADYLTPGTESTFQQSGKLTAEEFVRAGDFLVENYPSWQWSGGLPEKQKSYLPADKQMLITKNVPCMPKHETSVTENVIEGDDGDEWTECMADEDEAEAELGVADAAPVVSAVAQPAQDDFDLDDDDFDPDSVAGFDDPVSGSAVIDEEDPGQLAAAAGDSISGSAILQTRTYDMSITFDTYYSTPRVWLFGYGLDGQVLATDEWRDDFSQEHVDKTVTFESHPHMGYSCPSIHPCKHAEAMQRITGLILGKSGIQLDVKFYMLIFLKFIQSIIPNLEYDYTQRFEFTQ